jgi:hypothetical protein
MYSHKPIRRFGLEGEIYDDSHIIRLRDQYVFMVVSSMKNKGYAPRFDIDTDFSISYNGKTFDFKLSVYGVYVGKAKAKCIAGVDKNKLIPLHTIQKSKSNEVSSQQE